MGGKKGADDDEEDDSTKDMPDPPQEPSMQEVNLTKFGQLN